MKNKKGSLSLSVNAIVVFVLAFSMLGVGLFFTGMIREKIAGATDVLNPDELEVKPTSERPLTVAQQIEFKKNKDLTMKVGYYNTNNEESTDAKIGISECLSSNNEEQDPPSVVSSKQDIGSSEIGAYNIIIQKMSGISTGIFVCELVVFNGDAVVGSVKVNATNAAGENLYQSQEFFLNVVS